MLNEAELFVAFILKYLPEKRDLMIVFEVGSHTINDRRGPLNYQVLQPILLVQVSVHVLLHGLSRLLVIFAFPIEFDLRGIDVVYRVPQLLKRQDSGGRGRSCIRIGDMYC